MALYAFDGTWNADQPEAEKDTNVNKFMEAYEGTNFYRSGVGTRLGKVGKVVGGISGAGGFTRTEEALHAVVDNFKNGDRVIDVVGFSRGAAIAVHFANQVNKGHDLDEIGGGQPVRFLGVWDIVASFGIPGDGLNLGYDLNMPGNVERCFHAMALDERRIMFPVTRLAKPGFFSADTHLSEIWFRGVHSDVGGGNMNVGLSSNALTWMYAAAERSGIKIAEASKESAKALRKIEAAISRHGFELSHLIHQIHRQIRNTDIVHESVTDRQGSEHNNPPARLPRMLDTGTIVAMAMSAHT